MCNCLCLENCRFFLLLFSSLNFFFYKYNFDWKPFELCSVHASHQIWLHKEILYDITANGGMFRVFFKREKKTARCCKLFHLNFILPLNHKHRYSSYWNNELGSEKERKMLFTSHENRNRIWNFFYLAYLEWEVNHWMISFFFLIWGLIFTHLYTFECFMRKAKISFCLAVRMLQYCLKVFCKLK